MVKKQNLKEMFPEMPEQMHQTIMDTLANLDVLHEATAAESDITQNRLQRTEYEKGCTGKPKGRIIRLRRVAMLAAVLIVFVGMTVTAAALFSWDERVVEFFGNPSEALQEKMVSDGLVTGQEAVASNQGITISAVQAIQDETSIYVLLDVMTEGLEIECLDFGRFQLLTEQGVDLCKAITSGGTYFSVEEKEKGLPCEGTMMIRVDWTQKSKIPYVSLTLHFENLDYFKEPEHSNRADVIEGTWDIPLMLHDVADSTRIVQVNHPILVQTVAAEDATMFQDQPVIIQEITIEPMSIRMVMQKPLDLDEMDRERIDTIQISDAFGIAKAFLYGVKYVDGSQIELTKRGAGLSTAGGGFSYEGEFGSMIDVENVTAVLLGTEGEVEIPIE